MTQDYQAAGFAHLRAAVDPALVASWTTPILDAASHLPNMGKDGEIAAIFQPDQADTGLAGILGSAILGRIAADVLATGEIRLIAGAVYIKPPGAPATFWHQDLWFFPIVGAPMTTLWLPLTPIDEENAPMVYAAGSQRQGFEDWDQEAQPQGWPLYCLSSMAVGDVAIHDGWTLHGSKANVAARPREAIGLSFIRAGTRFATRVELQREPKRWQRLAGYLDHAGYREGDPIEGPACPLIALS